MALPRRTLALAGIGIAFVGGGGAALAASHGSSTSKPASTTPTTSTTTTAAPAPKHNCPHMGSSPNSGASSNY